MSLVSSFQADLKSSEKFTQKISEFIISDEEVFAITLENSVCDVYKIAEKCIFFSIHTNDSIQSVSNLQKKIAAVAAEHGVKITNVYIEYFAPVIFNGDLHGHDYCPIQITGNLNVVLHETLHVNGKYYVNEKMPNVEGKFSFVHEKPVTDAGRVVQSDGIVIYRKGVKVGEKVYI